MLEGLEFRIFGAGLRIWRVWGHFPAVEVSNFRVLRFIRGSGM